MPRVAPLAGAVKPQRYILPQLSSGGGRSCLTQIGVRRSQRDWTWLYRQGLAGVSFRFCADNAMLSKKDGKELWSTPGQPVSAVLDTLKAVGIRRNPTRNAKSHFHIKGLLVK